MKHYKTQRANIRNARHCSTRLDGLADANLCRKLERASALEIKSGARAIRRLMLQIWKGV